MVYTVFYKTSSFAGYCFLSRYSIHPKRYGVFSFKVFIAVLVKIQICSFIDTKYDLCWKAINTLKDEPILVYFFTKKDMKSFINRSGKYRPESKDSRLLALKQTIIRQLGTNHPLISALDYGVAFHNGDLPEDVRAVIESAYRDKVIKVLACTTTLAEGVNLPVSTLVIGMVLAFDRDESLDLGDYKNIVGRIGRALVDTEGKIFLIRYPDIYTDSDVAKLDAYYYGEKIANRMQNCRFKVL